MFRSLVRSFFVFGAAAAFGCSSGGSSGTTNTGGSGTTSSGDTTSSTTSSTSSAGGGGAGGMTTSSTTSSTTSTTSSTGTGGMGTGGMGTGGASTSTSTSTGTGGMGTGGMGTGGMGPDPNTLDQDGDGWTPLDGDCCDVVTANCQNPGVVNPGAFEYPGNNVDDDCNPATLDSAPPPSCSPSALFTNVTGDDLIKAMDLCQFTTETPATPKDKIWGVIQTKLLLADGSTVLPAANNVQVGVLTNYGNNVTPKKYATMGALSTGTARGPNDPGYVHPQNGPLANQVGNYNGNTQVTVQGSYLAANGGKPPSPPQCSNACTTGCDQAYDSVNLWARIRVPTNARSFSYQFKFYSAEFPEYLCNKFNDFFVALYKSSWMPDPMAMPPQKPLPQDGNIAFDANGNPVSVNNSFFQVCFPYFNAPAGTCPSGTIELIGTGMGGWGNTLTDGGGTDWLTNSAPVIPGETIELEFVVWDSGDHNVDSLLLLDHFRWGLTPSAVGVTK